MAQFIHLNVSFSKKTLISSPELTHALGLASVKFQVLTIFNG